MKSFKDMFSESTSYKGLFTDNFGGLYLGISNLGDVSKVSFIQYKETDIQEKISESYEASFINSLTKQLSYEEKNEFRSKEFDSFVSRVDYLLDLGSKILV